MPVAVVTLVVIATGLVACTPSPTVKVPAQLSTTLIDLAEQPLELELATRSVIRSCMADHGFDLPYDSMPTYDSGGALIAVAGLISSEKTARAIGYTSTQKDQPGSLEKFEAGLNATQLAQYQEAMRGGDDAKQVILTSSNGTVFSRSGEGCVATADEAVYGSVQNALAAENLLNEVRAQAMEYVDDADAALQPVLSDYHDCMKQAEYSVRGIGAGDLAKELFGSYRGLTDPPSQKEASLRLEDYTCQESSGIKTKLDALFLERSGTWVVENQGVILGTKELVDAAADRARKILAGPTP